MRLSFGLKFLFFHFLILAFLAAAADALPGTCKGENSQTYCGFKSQVSNCYCDKACTSYGDCCDDYKDVCNALTGTCKDSDGGQNFYTNGIVTTGVNEGGFSDFCLDSNQLIEYYCSGNEVNKMDYKCQNGCKDGVCSSEACNADLCKPYVCCDPSITPCPGAFPQQCSSCSKEICNPTCGNNICEEGESGYCAVCLAEPCPEMPCYSGTCPQDCQKIPCYELSSYPKMLVVGDKFNGEFVVGDKGSAGEIIALSDIQASFTKMGIKYNPARLASEIKDIKSINAIVVGTACSNAAAAILLGNPADCTEGLEPGVGHITIFQNNGFTQVLVSGYSDQDLRRAADVLADYSSYKLSGTKVKITIKFGSINVELVENKCGTICGNGICDPDEKKCTTVCPGCPVDGAKCPPCSETCEYTCPSDCPTTEVSETVYCIFSGSSTYQKCGSYKGECSGIDSCSTKVAGYKGEQIKWESSCDGTTQVSTIDGQDEKVVFDCSSTNQITKQDVITWINNNCYNSIPVTDAITGSIIKKAPIIIS